VTSEWKSSQHHADLLAAVAFVLLIACVNVANLLLRVARRGRRSSPFGARSEPRIPYRASIAYESVILALAAARQPPPGCLVHPAFVLCFQLDAMHLPMRPIDSIPMDGRVFLFALIVSSLTGVLFGIAPP